MAKTTTRLILLTVCLACQLLSACGTTIMGRYFYAPARRRDPFDRQKLYDALKARDTGKTSVLHDVVTIMETTQPPRERRYANGWVIFWGILSIAAHFYWLSVLFHASIDALFYGVPVDTGWWLSIAGNFAIGLIILIASNLASMFWLNRD